MIRSTNQKLGESKLIREPEHIARVWSAIEAALPSYWDKFIESERKPNPLAELVAKYGKPGSSKPEPEGVVAARVFDEAVDSYEKEAKKYRSFFHRDRFEDVYDVDPRAFHDGLARDVPVIANTLRRRDAELKKWKMHFRMAKPNELRLVFSNMLLDFLPPWLESHPVRKYAKINDQANFHLDPLDEDETMSMTNVIGMGIKSIVLYHLDPARLPARGRHGLYGLYFLSGRDDFGLPSESSEFLMINDVDPASDGSIIMDQNYWYPYGLFSLYALRVYWWVDQRAAAAGVTLDPAMRYVYVERFFKAVHDLHLDDLKTMRAHERFEVPG